MCKRFFSWFDSLLKKVLSGPSIYPKLFAARADVLSFFVIPISLCISFTCHLMAEFFSWSLVCFRHLSYIPQVLLLFVLVLHSLLWLLLPKFVITEFPFLKFISFLDDAGKLSWPLPGLGWPLLALWNIFQLSLNYCNVFFLKKKPFQILWKYHFLRGFSLLKSNVVVLGPAGFVCPDLAKSFAALSQSWRDIWVWFFSPN